MNDFRVFSLKKYNLKIAIISLKGVIFLVRGKQKFYPCFFPSFSNSLLSDETIVISKNLLKYFG